MMTITTTAVNVTDIATIDLLEADELTPEFFQIDTSDQQELEVELVTFSVPVTEKRKVTPDNVNEISEEKKFLVNEIAEFLEAHACIIGGETLDTDSITYVSKDATALYQAMKMIATNRSVSKTFVSDWESGAYFPYSSDQGRAWHDELIKQITKVKVNFQR